MTRPRKSAHTAMLTRSWCHTKTRSLAALLCFLVMGIAPEPLHADTGTQRIFLGQIDCSPAPKGCLYPEQSPTHRYLHVIVHDLAGNSDWQVRAGPDCALLNTVVLGGVPIDANEYREQVADLSIPTSVATGFAGCLSFEGRGLWSVYYYAAWFDDNPAPDGDTLYPEYPSLQGRPAAADLSVTYIHRDPPHAFDGSPNAPRRGEIVTYSAYVENSGTEPASGFDYVWSVDGNIVGSGTADTTLAPGASSVITLPWAWETGSHVLEFRLVPHGDDLIASNDRLEIRTNALTLGFWIERSAYVYFARYQYLFCRDKPCAGSDSFPDWLQRQIAHWNNLLATAVYPDLAPGGIADRIRVDAIHVVPDGSLPLAGSRATDSPDVRDHSVDLEWGLPAQKVQNTYRIAGDRAFDVDWALLHELGHARYLTDLYRFDAPVNSTVSIDIHVANGRAAVDPTNPLNPDAPLHAYSGDDGSAFYYQNQEHDLMSCTCTPHYSAYSALTLNRIRTQRARCGNFNTPCNIGEWFGDIPADTRLRLEDRVGRPLPNGTTVHTFFDSGIGYTGHRFTDSNSSVLRTAHGQVDLGGDPMRSRTSPDYAPQRTLLIEIAAPGNDTFCFLEPTDLNVATWLGYRDQAHRAVLTIRLGGQARNACNATLPEARVNAPFAVSPGRSSARLEQTSTPRGRRMQTLVVQLVGDGPAHNPMRNRTVIATDAHGQGIANAVTSVEGTAYMKVPVGVVQTVMDQTDNNLVISSAGGVAPPLLVRPR